MKVSRSAVFGAVLAVGLGGGAAVAAGGGNLGPDSYPEPACGERPQRPVRPESFRSNDEIEAYNAEVRRYNEADARFVACIQAYVDAAAEDIRMIKARVKAVVEEANRAAGGD